jgi:hypothetical protein
MSANEESLMEGPLLKKAAGAIGMMVGWRERKFILTPTRLLYFEPGRKEPKGTINLAELRSIEAIPEKKIGCGN